LPANALKAKEMYVTTTFFLLIKNNFVNSQKWLCLSFTQSDEEHIITVVTPTDFQRCGTYKLNPGDLISAMSTCTLVDDSKPTDQTIEYVVVAVVATERGDEIQRSRVMILRIDVSEMRLSEILKKKSHS
jgi:hypothetical protein